jgi:hypothetical protein
VLSVEWATSGFSSSILCKRLCFLHDIDKANQKTSSNQDRVVYDFTVGESAMNQDGTTIRYTRDYIEQQKAEIESSGKFDCQWK